MKGGLAMLLGVKPKKGAEDDEEESESAGDTEDLLGEAFDALVDKDRKGFVKLMKAAIQECSEEE